MIFYGDFLHYFHKTFYITTLLVICWKYSDFFTESTALMCAVSHHPAISQTPTIMTVNVTYRIIYIKIKHEAY